METGASKHAGWHMKRNEQYVFLNSLVFGIDRNMKPTRQTTRRSQSIEIYIGNQSIQSVIDID